MNRKIFFRPECCLMCLSCVLACQLHSLGTREARCIPPGRQPQKRLSMAFSRGTPWVWKCQQCTAAPCAEACVSGSLRQKVDGAGVEHHPQTCVACGSCFLACPFGIPARHPGENRFAKCNLCPQESIPPCVKACQSQALVYQDVSRFAREKKKRLLIYAAGDVGETLDSITGEKVNNATWPVASRQGTIAGTNMAGGNLACQHNFPTNPLNLFGVHVLAAGHCNEEAEGEALAEEAKGSYRRVLLKSGRLTGFILIGEVSRAGFLLSLMKKKEIVSDPGELLQKTFSYQKRLPRGYGYRHGSLFPDFPGERR